MAKKKIVFTLSEGSIDNAIRELEQYQKDVEHKTELLRQKVAERLAELAREGFNGAIASDEINGLARSAQVDVRVENREKMSVVIASGEDAVFVEFGAGVYHNGAVGSSPHPKGKELGMTIGMYGKGKGKNKVWGYYDAGEVILTHGTPAAMPMYKAVTTVCNEIEKIAKEVFDD